MGEEEPADCSWKKMVIVKSENQWTSTIKTERIDADNYGDTTDFSMDYNPDDDRQNAEQDKIKLQTEHSYQNMHYQNIHYVGGSSASSLQDPLSISPEGPKRRRRRGSGGSGTKNETPEERAVRLAKMSAYAAQRLANESPVQRAIRLKRMSEYAAKRLSQETPEQRANRLSRMSAYAARRLANESPDQRRARLTRMSAYAARRLSAKKIDLTAFNEDITKDTPSQS